MFLMLIWTIFNTRLHMGSRTERVETVTVLHQGATAALDPRLTLTTETFSKSLQQTGERNTIISITRAREERYSKAEASSAHHLFISGCRTREPPWSRHTSASRSAG
ncbi:uncharacterized, partial [Tachysurus ichikawai]